MIETRTCIADGDGDGYENLGVQEAELFANHGGAPYQVLDVGGRHEMYPGRPDMRGARRMKASLPLGYLTLRRDVPPVLN